MHLECWCACVCSSRSSWCRAVSHGWQWMVAVQAQRVATTQPWRSPVETSEFHAKLCGNVCCCIKDLHFVSVLRPCHCALPVGDSVSVSQEQLPDTLALARLFEQTVICWARVTQPSYLWFALAQSWVLTLFCQYANTHDCRPFWIRL